MEDKNKLVCGEEYKRQLDEESVRLDEKMYIYILELENNKYYVGRTINPKRRLQEHIDGRGSSWTKLHQYVKTLAIFEESCIYDEYLYTMKCIKRYGIKNVRGNIYTTVIVPEHIEKVHENVALGGEDMCYLSLIHI